MFRKISDKFRNFMIGRYGPDKLGNVLFCLGLVLMVLGMICGRRVWAATVFDLLSWVCLVVCIFRIYSRNHAARSRENQKFLAVLDRLRDRDHCYFRCPACRQSIRVPRGKGRIRIRCPKCSTAFIKKT